MSADFENLDPEQFLNQFAEAVRESRDQLEISQEELAARAGLHRTYISDVECGNRNLSMRTLCRLATALNKTPSRLMKLAEVKLSPEDAPPSQIESDAAVAFFNHAPCGFHSLDANGLVLRMNDTELNWLGYDRKDVIGKMNIIEMIAPEFRSDFEHHFKLLNETGRIGPLRCVLVRRDQKRLNVLISSSVLRDDGGKYLMNLMTVMDTSDMNAGSL